MVATLKQILSSQKKTDYRPEEPATAEVTQVGHTIVVLYRYIVYCSTISCYRSMHYCRCVCVLFTLYCSLFFQTCIKAVAHIEECTNVIKLSLDGKNQEVVLLEFGIRVHRMIYEMILTFTINSAGKKRIDKGWIDGKERQDKTKGGKIKKRKWKREGMKYEREIKALYVSWTTSGAMFLICDLNEYRKAVKEFKVSSVIMPEWVVGLLC